MKFALRPSFLVLGLALLPVAVLAQLPHDPTRPPAGYLTVDADPGEAGGGLVLQSVMISPTQKAAIISGVVVKLGEKYGQSVLTQVTENEVVLRSGGVNRTLKLYPGVNKRDAGQTVATELPRRGKAPDAGSATEGSASSR